MLYEILADLTVSLHFLWILFMLTGFVLTAAGFFKRGIFEWWLFRSLHLGGIALVSIMALLGKPCLLTDVENFLRSKYNPAQVYHGAFIARYLGKLVYPNVNPLILYTGTYFFAFFTLLVFVIRPPGKLKTALFRKRQKS